MSISLREFLSKGEVANIQNAPQATDFGSGKSEIKGIAKIPKFIGSVLGGGKVAEAAGVLGAKNVQRTSRSMEDIMKTQDDLIQRIREKKNKGESTFRLERALEGIGSELGSLGQFTQEAATGGITNRQVLASAGQLGITAATLGFAPGSAGATVGGKSFALQKGGQGLAKTGGLLANTAAGRIGFGGATGAASGAVSAFGEGGNLKDIAKGALIGGATGAAVSGLFEVGKGAVKFAKRELFPRIFSLSSGAEDDVFRNVIDNADDFKAAKVRIKGKNTEDLLKEGRKSAIGLRRELTKSFDDGINQLTDDFSGQRMALSPKGKQALKNTIKQFPGMADELAVPQNTGTMSVKEALKFNTAVNSALKGRLGTDPEGVAMRTLKKELRNGISKKFGAPVDDFLSTYGQQKQVFDAAAEVLGATKKGKFKLNPAAMKSASSKLNKLFKDDNIQYLNAITALDDKMGGTLVDDLLAQQALGTDGFKKALSGTFKNAPLRIFTLPFATAKYDTAAIRAFQALGKALPGETTRRALNTLIVRNMAEQAGAASVDEKKVIQRRFEKFIKEAKAEDFTEPEVVEEVRVQEDTPSFGSRFKEGLGESFNKFIAGGIPGLRSDAPVPEDTMEAFAALSDRTQKIFQDNYEGVIAGEQMPFLAVGGIQNVTPAQLAGSFKQNAIMQLQRDGADDIAQKLSQISDDSVNSFDDLKLAVQRALGKNVNNSTVRNWLKTAQMLFNEFIK